MKPTLLCIAILVTGIFLPKVNAQTETDSLFKQDNEKKKSIWNETDEDYYQRLKKGKLEALEAEKMNIVEAEKFDLKKQLEKIDERLLTGDINQEKATALKQEAAKKAAENIDNKTAIINNQIALTERDVVYSFSPNAAGYIEVGLGNVIDDNGSFLLGIRYKAPDKKPKFDKRTNINMVFAFGVGGTTGGGTHLGRDYKVWKSTYSEIGLTFRTRLLKDSNFWRLGYGISFQQNQLSTTDNKHFVNDNGYTSLEVFPNQVKWNRLMIENIVVPVIMEFGPSVKKESKDYFRYDASTSYKVGLGVFAGVNTGAVQWIKYVENDKNVKVKRRQDYNIERFVYGLKGYVGFGSLSIFANYELNTVFTNSAYSDHALYFGMRVDI